MLNFGIPCLPDRADKSSKSETWSYATIQSYHQFIKEGKIETGQNVVCIYQSFGRNFLIS